MITDEMVETGAKALVEAEYERNPSHKTRVSYARHDARAVLEAVAPMIRAAALEEAAKVADSVEDEQSTLIVKHSEWRFVHGMSIAKRIAEAIRAMKGGET
jgi:malic enzyme